MRNNFSEFFFIGFKAHSSMHQKFKIWPDFTNIFFSFFSRIRFNNTKVQLGTPEILETSSSIVSSASFSIFSSHSLINAVSREGIRFISTHQGKFFKIIEDKSPV